MQDQPLVLRIQALGVPEAHLEGTPLHFPTKKALALLLYLAVTGTPQPREHLAALFWPDREDERARSTLRSTLRLLRQTLTSGYAAVISSQPEGASEPSQSTDPSRPGGGRAAPKPIDLFLCSGHDRLGRDCLWLDRSFSPSLSSSTSARTHPPAASRAAADTFEPAGAHSASGSQGNQESDGVAVRLDLDLDVLEHTATHAARLAARFPAAHTDTFAGGEHVGGEHDHGAGGHDDEISQRLQHLASVASVCRGSFLAGFGLEDSDTFTDWVEQQRVYWQGRMDRVFEALSRLQLERGAFAAARETATQWVELNTLEETAYRRLMEAHAAAGDRTAALVAYARCRETLARTLGVEPAPETVALAERIRRQTTGAAGSARPPDADVAVRPSRGRTATSASGARPTAPYMPHMHPLGDPALLALPLTGRETEFAALVAAYERARQGAATAVMLAGAAGIGKTRLANEFLRWATQARGAEVLRGQAFETGGRLPYQPLVEALRTRLERERAPDDLLDDVWLVELSRLLPELRERYPDLAVPVGEDKVAAERLFEAVAQLGLALARQLRVSGDGAPGDTLVLFLDDAQWADVGTRDLVRFVVRRWHEAGVPAMVLLTVRREDLGTRGELREWLRELAREVGEVEISTVALRALGADTLHQLLAKLAVEDITDVSAHGAPGTGADSTRNLALPTTSPSDAGSRATSQTVAHLAQWLHAETNGQPLYLVQMLRALLEQGVLAWEERDARDARDVSLPVGSHANMRWRLRVRMSPQEIANLGRLLPASMRAVIQQRLERLSAPTRSFLMAGAVLGTRFRPEQAWAIADLDEASGLDALEEAERRLVIQVAPGGPGSGEGENCQFTHDKLREVIYTETGAVRRRVLHRHAYELLERASALATPAELAHHALLAGLHEPAFYQSVSAGDAALAVYAVRDAIVAYEQARHLLADQWNGDGEQQPAEPQARLYTQLGRAYEWIGAWEEARNAYQAQRLHARERGDHTLEGMALLRMALTAWHSFDMTAAQARAREALALVETTGDIALQAEAEWTAGQVETIAGEVDEALPHARRAVNLARAAELPELVARSQVRLAMTHILSGAWDEAVGVASESHACYAALIEEALAEKPDVRLSATATTTPAGRTQETPARWAFGGSLPATAAAHRAMEAHALSLRAFGEICRGNPQDGIEVGRTAHQLARDCASAYAQLYSGFILSVGLIEVGAYEEGLLAARQGLDAARANGDPVLTVHALASLAYARHALHQIEDARTALEEALALAKPVEGLAWLATRPLAYRCANRALAGDWEAAAAVAVQAVTLREALRARLVYFDFARHYETEALLRAGEAKRARVDIERLAERLRPERQDRRYQLVLLRMRAVLARFEGRIAEAIAHLEAAVRLAEEIGLPGEQWQILTELAGLRSESSDAAGAAAAQAEAESIVAILAARIADPEIRTTYLRATSHTLRASAT